MPGGEIIDLQRDGKGTIQEEASIGWVRSQFAKEKRGSIEPLRHEQHLISWDTHKEWVRSRQAIKRRIAVGSCPEARTIPELEECTCACSVPDPGRRHWMTCGRGVTDPRPARCELEKGLAIPLVARKEKPVLRLTGNNDIEEAMRSFREDHLEVATDGGCKEGATSIGVAVTNASSWIEQEDRQVKLVRASVGGADRSSFIGEVEAVHRVLLAAGKEKKNLQLIVDNSAVVGLLKRLLSNCLELPKYAWRQWLDMEEALIGRTHSVEWCPSHGKSKNWQPREDLDGRWMSV